MKRILIILIGLIGIRAMAQIGTWKHHLAYHNVQSICKADDELFVLASNDLYQYNLNDQSITTYDKINGLSDTHITHIAWCQQAKRLIAVYQNANIDLVETDGDIINISALYSKSITGDKTVNAISIDGIYAYLHCGFGIVKVNLQRAEISETYTPNMPDYPDNLPAYQDNYTDYINIVSTLNAGGPAYNHFYEAKFMNDPVSLIITCLALSRPTMKMTGHSMKRTSTRKQAINMRISAALM